MKAWHKVGLGVLIVGSLACQPQFGPPEEQIPAPPGAVKYNVAIRTYQLDRAGKKVDWPRRVTLRVAAIDSAGGHGEWFEEDKNGKIVSRGPHPLQKDVNTPHTHPMFVGGNVEPKILHGTVEVTAREMGPRTGVSCTVKVGANTISVDTEENHTGLDIELNVRCIIG